MVDETLVPPIPANPAMVKSQALPFVGCSSDAGGLNITLVPLPERGINGIFEKLHEESLPPW
jgi:hypothetical protein